MRLANRLAARVCLIIILAISIDVFWAAARVRMIHSADIISRQEFLRLIMVWGLSLLVFSQGIYD